ncbi:hypothetical protein VPHF35G1_0079 [Vibrio phage F35 g1]|nr:conserved hypothetical protein [Vibrio phage 115E34-1]CAH9013921.1 conserved hypothetical protein [Vibrio phage 455E52-1]
MKKTVKYNIVLIEENFGEVMSEKLYKSYHSPNLAMRMRDCIQERAIDRDKKVKANDGSERFYDFARVEVEWKN